MSIIVYFEPPAMSAAQYPDSFDQFSQILMPILQKLGIDIRQTKISGINNFIKA